MSQKMRLNFDLLFLLSVSFFGLLMAGTLTLYPPATQESFPWRKPIVGSIFGLVCVLGILAVFSPKKCSQAFHQEKGEANLRKTDRPEQDRGGLQATSHVFKLRLVHGHHPSCENFSSHEFQVGKRTFCTSCMGLLFGALITLAGTIAYFFNEWLIATDSLPLIGVGTLGVALGLLRFLLFNVRRRVLRFSLNTFFVIGSFLILVGIDTLIQSLFIDLFLILLSVFWLFTRIRLSQWDHEKICKACRFICDFRGSGLSASGAGEDADDDHYSKYDYYKGPYFQGCRYDLCLL